MRDVWLDLGYAARILRRNPGFGATAILTLALGIGATTTIFSVVDATLLRPRPYPDSERVMWVAMSFPSVREEFLPSPDYIEWNEQNRTFEGIAAYGLTSLDLTGGDEPERLVAGRVTRNFFTVLAVQPVLGRGFSAAEDLPRGPKAIVLSDGLWRRRIVGPRAPDADRPGGGTPEAGGVARAGARRPHYAPRQRQAPFPVVLPPG